MDVAVKEDYEALGRELRDIHREIERMGDPRLESGEVERVKAKLEELTRRIQSTGRPVRRRWK